MAVHARMEQGDAGLLREGDALAGPAQALEVIATAAPAHQQLSAVELVPEAEVEGDLAVVDV